MEEKGKDFKHLVRIANADLNGNKGIYNSLRNIKGVGFMFANVICKYANLARNKKTGELTNDEIKKIEKILENPLEFKCPLWLLNRRKDVETGKDRHLVSGDIRFVQETDIKMMKMIKSYKGTRHMAGLPARGQKTKSNFRKNKGKVSLGVKKKDGSKAGRV